MSTLVHSPASAGAVRAETVSVQTVSVQTIGVQTIGVQTVGGAPVAGEQVGDELALQRRRRPRSIDEILDDARSSLTRVTAAEARDAWAAGAVVVDIRPAAQRAVEGELTGALLVERNVLEWRFDPASDARLAIADYDLRVIVLCQEGYTSSLAAAALQDLGLHRATDVIGGFAAWRLLEDVAA